MIGVPNFGTFAIPLLYSGLNEQLRLIARAEHCSIDDLLDWVKMFVGTYEMLPFIGHHPDAPRLCDPKTYGALCPPQDRFDQAINLQRRLVNDLLSLPFDKLTYIAGFDQPTACRVKDWSNLHDANSYEYTLEGDGNIAHMLGLIPRVTTYYARHRHEWLPAKQDVIQAVEDILSTGRTTALPNDRPAIRRKPQIELVREVESNMKEVQREFALLSQIALNQEGLGILQFTVEQSHLKRLLYSGHPSALIAR